MLKKSYDPAIVAVLKTPDGKILETGRASYSAPERRAEFFGDYVSLFKMDTPLCISLIKNDTEIQTFSGKVYLSSQSLLRLVDVETTVLPAAARNINCRVDLPAAVSVRRPSKERFRLFAPKTDPVTTYEVKLREISYKDFLFSAGEVFTEGELVELKFEPVPPVLPARISKVFGFGDSGGNCLCTFEDRDPETEEALLEFLRVECLRELTEPAREEILSDDFKQKLI